MNNMDKAAIKSELNVQLGIDPKEVVFADDYAVGSSTKSDVFVYKEPGGFKVAALDNDTGCVTSKRADNVCSAVAAIKQSLKG